MKIAVPTEVEVDEYRVALTPAGARELVAAGHTVIIQRGAGQGSRMEDSAYESQGALLVDSPEELFAEGELIVKVKDPSQREIDLLTPGHTIFSYLHLAPQPQLANALRESGATCIAYETVELPDGRLPLLSPMSEIAGRMAAQVGAYFLEKMIGGRGVLLGGVAGVPPAKVVILGGGIVGANAAMIASGMLANVTVLDKNIDHLRALHAVSGRITTVMSTALSVEEHVLSADLVICAVLIPGATAPKLITTNMVQEMMPHSVIVDVSIDQGGCADTSRMTTHSEPTYVVDEVIHYCVGNIPGAVPITSTFALTNATLPYILEIANRGVNESIVRDQALARGVNVMECKITNQAVADSVGMEFYPLSSIIPSFGM